MIKKRRKNSKKYRILLLGLALFLLLAATGCEKDSGKKDAQESSSKGSSQKTEEFDEVKDMVFVAQDSEKKNVTLQDVENGVRYTLTYTGGTYVYNKSGSPITMEQIKTGELVEASFNNEKSELGKVQILKDAWVYEEAEDIEIDRANFRMKMLDTTYKFGERLFIVSKEREIGINELNEEDVLTIRGIGKNVCSINVERGHGFIVLTGYDNFVGGWVEVGTKVITRVTENMILVAPEGDYQLTVEKNGFGGYKNITVVRDEEIKVDVSDLKEAALQSGNVKFSITPSGAKLYIAGQETDYSNLVVLDYGTYKIKVTAEGYETYEGKVTVDNLVKEQEISLTKTGSDESSEETAASSDTSSPSDSGSTEEYKVIINDPEGVEVYLDGAYVGKAPVSFKKTAGSHTVTFRKDGYTTKSYTIEVDSEKKDLTMAFPALEAKSTTGSTSSSTTSSMEELAGKLLDSVLSN